jgi:hypothetical protein
MESDKATDPFLFMNWALEQQVSTVRAKAVLLVLAAYCNNRGQCWPSRQRIALETIQSIDTVDRIIKYLVKEGLIQVEPRRRKNGSSTTSLITLLVNHDGPFSTEASLPSGTAAVARV